MIFVSAYGVFLFREKRADVESAIEINEIQLNGNIFYNTVNIIPQNTIYCLFNM